MPQPLVNTTAVQLLSLGESSVVGGEARVLPLLGARDDLWRCMLNVDHL